MWCRSALLTVALAAATASACGRSMSGVEPAAGEGGEPAGATMGGGSQSGSGSGAGNTAGSSENSGRGGAGTAGTGGGGGGGSAAGAMGGGDASAGSAMSGGAGAAGESSAGESGGLGPPGCVLGSRSCGSGSVGFECPPETYYDLPESCSGCIDPTTQDLQCPTRGYGNCTGCCCEPTRGGCEAQTITCVGYPSTPNRYRCIGAYDPPSPGCVLDTTLNGIDALCCP